MRPSLKASEVIPKALVPALLAACLIAAAPGASAADPGGEPAANPDPETQENDASPAAIPELASGAPVDIRAALGFSGVFRLGGWTPVTVTLENRGTHLTGHLEVRVPDGDELGGNAFTTVHRRPIDLPGDSRKRFPFTVFLKSFSRPLVIRVVAGGREQARKVTDLRSRVTNARIVLVLGRDADLDYLNDEAAGACGCSTRGWSDSRTAGRATTAWPPSSCTGSPSKGLSARQYEALTKWLAGGGVLAVSGGPDYALLRTPRLATLLPGLPAGLVRLPDGVAAGKALGAPLPARQPFHVNHVPRFEGRVLHRSGAAPLVIERPFGRGRVLYLTFDVARPPFDGWTGMARLWHTLLDLPPLESLSAHLLRGEEASALPGLIRSPPLAFPGHPVVLVFIALYLGFLAAVYHLRPERGWGRRSLPWLRWAAPVVFAPAAFLVFGPLLFPSGPVAVVAARIAPHPQGPFADLDLELGMFSNTGTPLRLQYRVPDPVFRPVRRGSAPSGPGGWLLQDGITGASLVPETHGRYVLHALKGRDVIAYDLRAALVEGGDGLRLEVRNRSGRSLRDVWLVFDEHAYPLGALPADAEWTRVLDRDRDASPLRDRSWRRLLAGSPDLQRARTHARADMVERELARLRERGAGGPDEALLLAFSPSPLRLGGASAAWRRHEIALVLLRIPVTRVHEPGGFRS